MSLLLMFKAGYFTRLVQELMEANMTAMQRRVVELEDLVAALMSYTGFTQSHVGKAFK